MKNLFRISLLIVIAIGASCSGSKKIATETATRYFVIGSGGGFTGKYDIFKIHNDGRVEKLDASFENYASFKTLPLDSTNVYFEMLDHLELQNLKFNHPDNMTWYIEVNNGVDSNRVSWGDLSHPIRQDIDTFFKRVNKTVKTTVR